LEGFDSVFGRESPHNQCQLTVHCSLDGSTINPLHIFGDVGTATVHLHNKFCVFHSLPLLLSSAEERAQNVTAFSEHHRSTIQPVRYWKELKEVLTMPGHRTSPVQQPRWGQPALYFSTRIGVTLTAVRDWPHSKQQAFNRDVINPQDGHILL